MKNIQDKLYSSKAFENSINGGSAAGRFNDADDVYFSENVQVSEDGYIGEESGFVTTHPKSLPIVRLIVDDNAEFVIARELNEAVNVYQRVVCASPEAGYVDVMEVNVALKIWETYGETLNDIEFIVVPITRTKHCFTPIKNGADLSKICQLIKYGCYYGKYSIS
ncbi:hypothetical protein L3Y34_019356 [Caenorhabditis briggsae]|uniref:Uncharacterized protein n=1 Tax=Caenorhabditis briggsae TaxID=6238 RepID=A0AAE9DQM3_CAEBR|nr:hypothetical protein L3Y34_019356 [Caenorhabditis briggsae]